MRLLPVVFVVCVSLSFVSLSSAASTSVGKRAVRVKGQLTCGGKPAENVRVRLFRVKQEKKDDLDQILDENLTGPSGMFEVERNTNGFPLTETDIQPVVTFYHSCAEDAAKVDKNGYRKFNYNVPEEYVNLGAKAKKTYDVGTLNIEVEFPGEKHDKKFVAKKPQA